MSETTDPYADELQKQIDANKALVNGLKYEYGQKLLRAQQGEDDVPSAFELSQIKKLESQIANDELFLLGRRLTRRPSGG